MHVAMSINYPLYKICYRSVYSKVSFIIYLFYAFDTGSLNKLLLNVNWIQLHATQLRKYADLNEVSRKRVLKK